MEEKILFETHPSWKCLIPDILLIFVFIGMFTIWKTIIKKVTTNIKITDKSIYGKKGLFKTETMESPIKAITSVKVEKSFFGNLLNYRTIHINTAGGNYSFEYIDNPENVKKTILNELK